MTTPSSLLLQNLPHTTLAQPSATWLEARGLGALRPVLGVAEAFGYGPIETVPALYMMRFFSPGVLGGAGLRRMHEVAEGFETVFRRLAEGLDVCTGTALRGATLDGASGIWTLDTTKGAIEAEHVVVACEPAGVILDRLLNDARRPWLIAPLDRTPYVSVLMRVDQWFPEARRVFAPAGYPNYNTVFTAEALRSGDYQNVLNAQGRNNLWLVSSILAQEDWRDLCALGYDVAEKIALAGTRQRGTEDIDDQRILAA